MIYCAKNTFVFDWTWCGCYLWLKFENNKFAKNTEINPLLSMSLYNATKVSFPINFRGERRATIITRAQFAWIHLFGFFLHLSVISGTELRNDVKCFPVNFWFLRQDVMATLRSQCLLTVFHGTDSRMMYGKGMGATAGAMRMHNLRPLLRETWKVWQSARMSTDRCPQALHRGLTCRKLTCSG